MIVCPPIFSTVASGRMRKSGADSVASRSPSSVSEPSSRSLSSSDVSFDISTFFQSREAALMQGADKKNERLNMSFPPATRLQALPPNP